MPVYHQQRQINYYTLYAGLKQTVYCSIPTIKRTTRIYVQYVVKLLTNLLSHGTAVLRLLTSAYSMLFSIGSIPDSILARIHPLTFRNGNNPI